MLTMTEVGGRFWHSPPCEYSTPQHNFFFDTRKTLSLEEPIDNLPESMFEG